MGCSALIEFVLAYRRDHPAATKQQIAAATAGALNLTKHRSVYACEAYAVRFAAATGKPFSNWVLSLSALRKVDSVPVVVVVVRPNSTDFLLANATLMKKVSHSSHRLAVDNIRGSFLGHDILREYEGIANRPENFETLFAIHQEFTWEENIERLVEATNAIAARGKRFTAGESEVAAVLDSPQLADRFVGSTEYRQLKHQLAALVAEQSADILEAAHIDNVNVRGNTIEQLITGGINEHGLADMVRFVGRIELQLEIKTKLLDRASSPKAYNIDKLLEVLSTGTTAVAFLFVGIDRHSECVVCATVSVFDTTVLDATRIQHHWAGRNSRGVTQLTGNLTPLFSPDYQEVIDVSKGQEFLGRLLDL